MPDNKKIRIQTCLPTSLLCKFILRRLDQILFCFVVLKLFGRVGSDPSTNFLENCNPKRKLSLKNSNYLINLLFKDNSSNVEFQPHNLYLQPPHFHPSGVVCPCCIESQLHSVSLPELHAFVIEYTTPALVIAYMKAVSLLPIQKHFKMN